MLSDNQKNGKESVNTPLSNEQASDLVNSHNPIIIGNNSKAYHKDSEQTNSVEQPTKQQTIAWLSKLNKPAFPIEPCENELNGKQAKQPAYYDKNYFKSVEWKQHQQWHSKDSELRTKLLAQWHKDKRIGGVSTLGGFNGEYHLFWVDFDVDNFESEHQMQERVSHWIEKYQLQDVPAFSTPSGGLRFVFRSVKNPSDWGANNGFTFIEGGTHKLGEILATNGGHTLLPPTKGTNGKYYQWINKPLGDPFEIESLESVGLFKVAPKSSTPTPTSTPTRINNGSGYDDLDDIAKARLYLDALSSYRADDYEQWVKVGMALYSVSDILLTDWDNWSRCSSKYNPGDCEKKWRSFNGSGGITLGSLYHWAIEDGFTFPKNSNHNGNGNGKTSRHTNGKKLKEEIVETKLPLTREQVLTEIDKLIAQDLSNSQKRTVLNELAKIADWQVFQLEKLYDERLKEIEITESQDLIKEQLESILKANNTQIDIATILPEQIANPIKKLASWLNLKPEVYAQSLLVGLSSVDDPNVRIVLNHDWDFEVSPNIFSGIVAPSSQKKTPILKAMVTNPLKAVQKKRKEQWEQAKQQWENDIAIYEARKEELKKEKNLELLKDEYPEGPPKEPSRPICFFTKATGEGITYQFDKQADQGMLYLKDELAGLFKSQNQYRGGRGSDEEDLLEYYDGTGGVVLRADGIRSEHDKVLLSILGSIQPSVLEKLIGDGQDSNGKWARFDFINQPLSASTMSADGGSFDLSELIKALYNKADENIGEAPTTYKLSREAFNLFCQAYNRCESRRVDLNTTPCMQQIWGKASGKIGKYAYQFHRINALAKGEIPSEVIEVEPIKAAIKWVGFLASQIETIFSQVENDDPQKSLPHHLSQIIDVAKRNPTGITARNVIQQVWKLKKYKTSEIRSMFVHLADIGWGTTEGTGTSLKYVFSEKHLQHLQTSTASTKPSSGRVDVGENTQILQSVDECVDECRGIVDENIYTQEPSNHKQLDDVKGQIVDVVDVVDENQIFSENTQNKGVESVDENIYTDIYTSGKTSTPTSTNNHWLPYSSEVELVEGDLICSDKGVEMKVAKVSNGYVNGTVINESKPRPGYCVIEDVALYRRK